MQNRDPMPALETALPELVERLATGETLLLFGPSGSGKSSLARTLGAALAERGHPCHCLSADPGSPAFGVPGAVNLGHWQGQDWQLLNYEALCSLDAARFRLPLAAAAARLRQTLNQPRLIIDAAGLVRGVAAAELLPALVAATKPHRVILLLPDKPPLPQECRSLPVPVHCLRASPAARPPHRHEHRQQRTRLWEQFLEEAVEQSLELSDLARLGTPPPLTSADLWPGAMIALGGPTGTLTLGEAVALEGSTLRFRGPVLTGRPVWLLIRDAIRDPARGLVTRRPPPARAPAASLVYPPAGPTGPLGPQVTTKDAVAELVNGIFEDPLLLLQLHRSGRCLLFDLGESGRIPLRLLHRVSDIFISHGHIDHIGGFMGLLRARLGAPVSCRLYGPPGLADHIQGFLDGVLWDRIGDNGPGFEVGEFHGECLHRFQLQAGQDRPSPLPARHCPEGVILSDPKFTVRALALDHRVPVLAYAFEPVPRLHVSKTRLDALGWPTGPWLGELKAAQRQGALARLIELPHGQRLSAGELSRKLLNEAPVEKLVYATDLADTPSNRQRLATFARGAHSLFLEACFANRDWERARKHGHLTTLACGEIGAAAGVKQLVPFHFSRRYATDPAAHYREIEAAFGRAVHDG